MPTYCVAYNCTNYIDKKSGLSAHKFPKDPEQRKRWVIATKRKGFIPTDKSALCSRHFDEADFEVGGLCRRLKKGAVPTIFDFPAHVQHNPPKRRRIINKIKSTPNENQQDGKKHEGDQILFENKKTDKTDGPITSTPPLCASGSSQEQTPTTPHASPIMRATPSFSPTKVLLRRKVKILQQRLKRREKKIKSLKDMILVLRHKVNAPDRLLEVLKNNFSGLPLHMLINSISNKEKSKHAYRYSEKMKEFALTMYFYSPKAYRFLRKNGFLLPNPSTLRCWLSKFDCSPGFLNEVFIYLKNNVKTKDCLKNVNLTFDCMSIRKQLIYNQHTGKNLGYSDLGLGENVDDKEELATEALVFQIVSLKENFKCAIAYFFISSINANFLSQLIKMAIIKLRDVGIVVHNITCDGPSNNVSALQKLGCKLPSKPYFNVEGIAHKICVMLDPCHMLKLCRNTLADKKTIVSGNGELIEFKFIENLLTLQTNEGLKFANKLTHCHVFFKNKKMNVRLAAQMLSASVANALEFLLKSNHPDFIGCEETITFIRVIDRLFDLLNTRNPYGLGYKTPLKKSNLNSCMSFLKEAYVYISELQVEGVNILKHARKTFALGFLTCINSIQILGARLLNDLNFKYVLCYKFSQDHIELLFSCIRARGGRNNNPNVVQFRLALRQLMFRNRVEASTGSNCLDFDEHHQDSVLSFQAPTDDDCIDNGDDETDKIVEDMRDLSESYYFRDNILYYVSGFIVRKVDKLMKCEECSLMLHNNSQSATSYSTFTSLVSMGHLVTVSSEVLKLVKYFYSLFVSNKGSRSFCSQVYISRACTHFQGSLFGTHSLNSESGNDSHEIKLIKLIGSMFFKTMCFAYAKEQNIAMNKSRLGIRQRLNKIVLFQNV